jgi:hypothetical protein
VALSIATALIAGGVAIVRKARRRALSRGF